MKAKSAIDMEAHRSNKNYSSRTLCFRVLWRFANLLFCSSPRHLYSFRNGLLRLFGAKIGKSVRIYPTAKIFYPWNLKVGDFCTIGPHVTLYNLGEIILEDNIMLSQGSHLCAGSHDYTQPHLPLTKPSIHISRGTWVCAEAFIGPGVTVGHSSVVGARAVVTQKYIPEGSILRGNPAEIIKTRS